MPETLALEIATPERLLIREQVSDVQVPARNGYLGILPGHAPLLAELGTGELSYVVGGRKRYLAVNGGWVEVFEDHVRVLAVHAERADEIDVRRAEEALKRAQDRLSHPNVALDVARALNSLNRAEARLGAARHR